MGRRSSKSSPTMGAALPFDTVGMTILPGRALPDWAEPPAPAEMSAPELIADSLGAALPDPSAQVATSAPAPEQGWAAPPTTHPAPAGQAATSPEPAFAMAGAALAGAHAAAPAGYGHPNQGYTPQPSRYPAAPAAGLAAMTAPTAPPHAPEAGHAPAAASGQGWPAAPTPPGTTTGGMAPTAAGHGAPGQVAAMAPEEHLAMGGGLATATAPDATRSLSGSDAAQGAHVQAPAPEAPSSGWTSPERPVLSPEHVALLSWWADMIAAGQLPTPAGTPGPQSSAPEERTRRSFPFKAAAVGLVAVAAVGAAAVVGPRVMASNEPVVVPVTEVSMPASVGGLVAITDPAIGAELETLLGFGLRPAGVTVTGAYATAAGSPVAMAAMATTMGAPAEAVGQVAAWAERTGATVAPSVTGTGANEGITCAAVEAIPHAQPGSFCVWTSSGKRGQTYSVGLPVEDAQTLTNQFRTLVAGA